MNKEQVTKILEKIKETVGENNYKLALSINGHRTGKIKEIIMCSKDAELLLEYVEQLEKQVKKQKEAIDKVINLIVKETKSMPTNGCKIRLIEILDILNEVSE